MSSLHVLDQGWSSPPALHLWTIQEDDETFYPEVEFEYLDDIDIYDARLLRINFCSISSNNDDDADHVCELCDVSVCDLFAPDNSDTSPLLPSDAAPTTPPAERAAKRSRVTACSSPTLLCFETL